MQSTYELVIHDDAGMTTIVPLGQAELSIGRKPGNSIQLNERNVSRNHARLVPAGSALGIEDLGSYTGVLVNGRRIAGRATIDVEDRVQIGDYQLALRRVAVVQGRSAPGVPDKTQETQVLPVIAPGPQVAVSVAPAQQDPGPVKRKWLGIGVGVGIVALLCGVIYQNQASAPVASQKAAPPPRVVQSAVHQKEAVPTIASLWPSQQNQKTVLPAAPPVPPIAPITPVHKVESPRRGNRVPPVHIRPAADETLTPDQSTALLADTQVHYINGEYTQAIRLALRLRNSQDVGMTKAWRIVGAAACKLGDYALINEAYRHVDVVSRQYMLYVCQQAGAKLSSGHFIPAQ